MNKLDALTKGTKRFSNPQALSSALVVLGFGLLNSIIPLVLASNYVLYSVMVATNGRRNRKWY